MAGGQLLDVTQEIKLDHDNVRELFDRYKATSDAKKKRAIANTLIREMAIHSDAEEVSVYNDYATVGLSDVATHNKEDHAEVKKLVYAADSHGFDKPDYDDVLAKAVTAFDAHAREEETDQHPTLRQKLSAEDNNRIARAFLKARTMVPSRPHPWAPQTGGIAQKAAGAQGKLHDKVVETLTDRDFVDVKYTHPEF
ncbi:uncharacterized protein C8Q71DRAFT_202758 [Rhodofomes roseus]|uniref:Hemerythrin-like domain-containing protein n=1 Tax=Rhodofomes roseus TaxID=34475 RepID=A0ABQ8KVV3_9APHY|nr:uncharacterized protein C8Q71DRAFT_202758 [Rhodofomes roseus]KAH9842425.1 hypothetical protein C8Q71DRAFT_202758 [Rhodofomes roseus]